MDQNKDEVFVGKGEGEDKPEMGEEQKREMELRASLVELQEQVTGLKALLSDKQENINIAKIAVGKAISTIESKREDEKTDFDREIVLELEKGLKWLEENTDIFSDAIVTFQERVDHLNLQVATIKSHCSSAEGEVDNDSRG